MTSPNTTRKSPARTAAERQAEAKAALPADVDAAPADVQVDDAPPVVPPPGDVPPGDLASKLDALLNGVERLAAKVDNAATTEQMTAALDGVRHVVDADKAELRQYVDSRMDSVLAAMAEQADELRALVERAGDGVLEAEKYADQGSVPGGIEHVHSAIVAVMNDVRAIGKDRKAPANAGGYAFRGIDAIMDLVGASMRTHQLYVLPSVTNRFADRWVADGRTWTSVTLHVRYTFVSAVDGSTAQFDMMGEGRDMGDKATSKAAAMAFKYGLLQALCIPVEDVTGMDSENDHPVSAAPDQPQQSTRQSPAYQQAQQQVRQQAPAQQRPPAQAAPPPPDRQAPPQSTPLETATRALAAARRATNEDQLNSIGQHAAQLHVLDVEVEGQPLRNHLWAAAGLLSGTMPPPPAAPQQAPPADPWATYPDTMPPGAGA